MEESSFYHPSAVLSLATHNCASCGTPLGHDEKTCGTARQRKVNLCCRLPWLHPHIPHNPQGPGYAGYAETQSTPVKDQMAAQFRFALRYETMSPDHSLAETPGNF